MSMWPKIQPFYHAPHPAFTPELIERAQPIKLLALDVDGVLTAAHIAYTHEGDEIKTFNAKDGHGIWMLNQVGIVTAIITGRKSPVNERRAKELDIPHLFQGIKNKGEKLDELLSTYNLTSEQVAYMGDDLPDIAVLERVGLATCPNDAVYQVKPVCHWVIPVDGGQGAVRMLCDLILYSQAQQLPLLSEAQ